jgi:chromosomal replication initiation ATPase DnaA
MKPLQINLKEARKMNLNIIIKRTEHKAGLNPGDLKRRDQRLKKKIGNVQVAELRRALVFVAKQNTTLTYEQLAKKIGFKRHSTVIISYRNAQNYWKQGDDKFRKALELVVKN